jgi:deoxyribonucleoside regulator
MDSKRINQIIRISKHYYESDMGQVEIARQEGISKSTVSRLLKLGKELGLVEVRIKEPMMAHADLEAQFLAGYPLRNITIIPALIDNPQIIARDVYTALIEDLPKYIDDDSVLGVAWGTTLEMLSTMLVSIRRQHVSVIQLTGGYSRLAHESSALKILQNFASAVGGEAYVIPAPAMVDAPFIAEAIKQDSQIKQILAMAGHCQTAVYSAGFFGRPSVIYEMGLLTDEQYRVMEKGGCVGDCCSHFINADGDIYDPALDARVVGASLETIQKIPNKLLVASGINKGQVIHAALKGGLADHLYIDAPTAREVLKFLG